MLQQPAFMPQRQFHVLINLENKERHLTVLPNHKGRFRVIEQGKILGEVDYTPHNRCICSTGRLRKPVMHQLEKHIKDYYTLYKGLPY
jgi:hypothetical protein